VSEHGIQDEDDFPPLGEEEVVEPEQVVGIRRNVQLPDYMNFGMRPALRRMRHPSDTNNMLVEQLIRDGSVSK